MPRMPRVGGIVAAIVAVIVLIVVLSAVHLLPQLPIEPRRVAHRWQRACQDGIVD